jgi:hypothetical protein
LAELNTLAANVNIAGTFDEWSHVAVTLPAKRTERVLFVCGSSAARGWVILRGHTRLLVCDRRDAKQAS